MAQAIESRFICDGRYRISSIKALGRRRGRIIEIEDVDRRLLFHGTASKLEQMALEFSVAFRQQGEASMTRSSRHAKLRES